MGTEESHARGGKSRQWKWGEERRILGWGADRIRGDPDWVIKQWRTSGWVALAVTETGQTVRDKV